MSCFPYLSMLEDDLKLSSSEDSDGEQDPAKNAARNTLGRWTQNKVYWLLWITKTGFDFARRFQGLILWTRWQSIKVFKLKFFQLAWNIIHHENYQDRQHNYQLCACDEWDESSPQSHSTNCSHDGFSFAFIISTVGFYFWSLIS